MTGEEAEFHGPDWVLGQTTMVEMRDGSLVARRTSGGRDSPRAHHHLAGASEGAPPAVRLHQCAVPAR